MGAKASTASGANGASSTGQHHNQHMLQSPRARTFSSSSSSTAADMVGNPAAGSSTGFSLLRAIPGMHITAAANQSAADRQRAHSLSSVPDAQQANGVAVSSGPSNYLAANSSGGAGMLSFSPEATFQQVTVGNDSDSIAAATAGALALGRVYTATSLPSHIWSLNGKRMNTSSNSKRERGAETMETARAMCIDKASALSASLWRRRPFDWKTAMAPRWYHLLLRLWISRDDFRRNLIVCSDSPRVKYHRARLLSHNKTIFAITNQNLCAATAMTESSLIKTINQWAYCAPAVASRMTIDNNNYCASHTVSIQKQ